MLCVLVAQVGECKNLLSLVAVSRIFLTFIVVCELLQEYGF